MKTTSIIIVEQNKEGRTFNVLSKIALEFFLSRLTGPWGSSNYTLDIPLEDNTLVGSISHIDVRRILEGEVLVITYDSEEESFNIL